MYIKEKRPVLKDIVIACKCDCCGKVVAGDSYPTDWHSFSSHHSDWGNDNVDSYEYWLVCSPDCYIKIISGLLNSNKDRDSFELDEMSIQFASKLIDKITI